MKPACYYAQQIWDRDDCVYGNDAEMNVMATAEVIQKAMNEAAEDMKQRAAHAAHSAMFDLTMGKAGGDMSTLSPSDCCYAALVAIQMLTGEKQ